MQQKVSSSLKHFTVCGDGGEGQSHSVSFQVWW
jgi:hypothetical protein